MSFDLRPYQLEAIQTIISSWRKGINGQMVSLPTGTGKTIIFCAFLRYLSEEKKRIDKQQQQSAAEAGELQQYDQPLPRVPESTSTNNSSSSSTASTSGGDATSESQMGPGDAAASSSTNSSSSSSGSYCGRGLRILILAQREELLQQALDKMENVVWPGVNVTKVNANVKDMSGQVSARRGFHKWRVKMLKHNGGGFRTYQQGLHRGQLKY
jgi:Rad3-related DNA helicase